MGPGDGWPSATRAVGREAADLRVLRVGLGIVGHAGGAVQDVDTPVIDDLSWGTVVGS
jgi:hypothetical protein